MKKIVSFFMIYMLALLMISCDSKEPIDEITEYQITIHPTEEGNLMMSYHIEWHVLDDSKEGPLEWVKIGVPNQYVYHPQAKSEDIQSISFHYSSDEGSFIRCDLARAFYKDEVAILDFSFLQTHFYTLENDEVQFQFMPGWFDGIQVQHLAVYWEKENVKYWNKDSKNITTNEDDTYLIWETALDYGETISVEVTYERSYFSALDINNANPNSDSSDSWIIWVIFGFMFLVFLILILVKYFTRDEYFSYRGFSGYPRRFPIHFSYHRNGKVMSDPRVVNSRYHGHSGGSSCACACACACAGGGRAGCSRKDFYNPTLKTGALLEKIKE